METRVPQWRSFLMPIAFVLACTLLTILAWRSFGGATPLEPRGYRLTVPLKDAPNLFHGADVRISGVTVGRVSAMQQRGGRAEAVLDIDSSFAPLRAGTRATLRSKTLLGEGFLELAPGSRDAEFIPDGGALRARDVVPAQRLDDVLATFAPQTRADLRALARGLAASTRGAGEHLNRTLWSAQPGVEGLETTLGVLDEQEVSLRRVIRNSATVVGSLGRRRGALRSAIEAADAVVTVTADRRDALRATVRALPPFLQTLEGAATTLGDAERDLRPAADGLAAVAPALAPALRTVRATAPEAQRLLRALPATLRAADRGLPALERILRGARPSLAHVHPVLRELQPVLELLAEVRDSAVTTFVGVGQIHNGTFVAEDNRVQHYASGLITVWNESIGGWVRRLPSNRGNTYPKPGFLEKIGSGLESFDCRHVDNPAVLPPLGGTPPCVTQGPWTFKGQNRYYPTLRPAGP